MTTHDPRAGPDLFADARDDELAPDVRRPPKGYARTDEHVRGEICERLSRLPIDWSELEVVVSGFEVTLRGIVASRAMKIEAERIARHVDGVRNVVDEVQVAGDAML